MRRVLLMAGLLVAATGVARAADAGADTDRIERGRYLARAADCAACHTSEGGTPYAGGHPIETPFGTVYGTNITPDDDYGIGDYSADDFHRALTEGELPDGTQLYPAMPYTDYHGISRADSDALYAYFMSLDPVHQQSTQTDLAWPFSMRWTLNAWNWLFAPDDSDDSDDSTADRGRYLVDTLGHCGACHTPRNAFGAVESDHRLEGAVIGGVGLHFLDLRAAQWVFCAHVSLADSVRSIRSAPPASAPPRSARARRCRRVRGPRASSPGGCRGCCGG